MSINKSDTEKPSSASGAGHAGPGAGAGSTAAPESVVDVRVEVKKKKKRYSRGLRDVQEIERGLAKANSRIAKAISSGFSEYYRRDRESSRKRRDGSIRDAVTNWSEGLSEALRRGSRAPADLGAAINTKTVRRTVRQIARLFAPPFLR